MTSTISADVAPPAPPVPSTESISIEQGDSPIEHDHFVLSGGLRQVKPYLFDFICSVKPRFAGSKMVDFMASEFPSMPREYYERAASEGRLRQESGAGAKKKKALTEGKSKRQLAREAKRARAEGSGVAGEAAAAAAAAAPAEEETKGAEVKKKEKEEEQGDEEEDKNNVTLVVNATIRHLLHRHEPPSLDLPLRVLGRCEESGLWAVGKPPGMPVHAAGGYRKSTVCGLLEAAARAAGRGPPNSSALCPNPSTSTPTPTSTSSSSSSPHPSTDLVVPWPAYLHPLHRLDKPVSGVLLFADGGAAAERCRAQLADRRSVSKVYVARVLGAFPARLGDIESEEIRRHVVVGDVGVAGGEEAEKEEEEDEEEGEGKQRKNNNNQLLTADVALSWDSAEHRAKCFPGSGPKYLSSSSFSSSDLPSSSSPSTTSPAQSGRAGAPRAAATSFRLLSVSPASASAGGGGRATSLVECRPLTGRTHQIRAHLGFLGHPIANDALYHFDGRECLYAGPERPRLEAHGGGRGSGAGGAGCFVGEKKKKKGEKDDENNSSSSGGSRSSDNEYISAEDVAELLEECGWSRKEEDTKKREEEKKKREEKPPPSLSPLEQATLDACPFCPSLSRPAAACELRPLWLHARLYEGQKEGGGKWRFECPVPRWASEEFVPRMKK